MSNSNPTTRGDIVDLRSDTVTRPTEEMYDAMRSAPLGDDVLGDDPTVALLEKTAATKMRKEAALFVPSGTMGNQIAVATHTNPGDAMLIEEEAHILYYEVGASAVLGNVVSWTLPSRLGVMDPEVVAKRMLKADLHTPGTRLLCLENTHNRGGGTVIPLSAMAAYRTVSQRGSMAIHLDGARVFNAAIALGVEVGEISQHVDSVNFCLSKGLRSPIGSVLCGSSEFIARARIWRKRLGGGMRQAGILAACGLISVNKMVDRLAEDHENARRAAHALMALPGLSVPLDTVQTNIVLVQTEKPAAQWQSLLTDKGVWCFPVAAHRLRLVFHADVDAAATQRAIDTFVALAGGA